MASRGSQDASKEPQEDPKTPQKSPIAPRKPPMLQDSLQDGSTPSSPSSPCPLCFTICASSFHVPSALMGRASEWAGGYSRSVNNSIYWRGPLVLSDYVSLHNSKQIWGTSAYQLGKSALAICKLNQCARPPLLKKAAQEGKYTYNKLKAFLV